MIDHLEIESTVLHKESEEAQAQMQREGANKLGKSFLFYIKFSGKLSGKLSLTHSSAEAILQKKTSTKKSGGVGSVAEGIFCQPCLFFLT